MSTIEETIKACEDARKKLQEYSELWSKKAQESLNVIRSIENNVRAMEREPVAFHYYDRFLFCDRFSVRNEDNIYLTHSNIMPYSVSLLIYDMINVVTNIMVRDNGFGVLFSIDTMMIIGHINYTTGEISFERNHYDDVVMKASYHYYAEQ